MPERMLFHGPVPALSDDTGERDQITPSANLNKSTSKKISPYLRVTYFRTPSITAYRKIFPMTGIIRSSARSA